MVSTGAGSTGRKKNQEWHKKDGRKRELGPGGEVEQRTFSTKRQHGEKRRKEQQDMEKGIGVSEKDLPDRKERAERKPVQVPTQNIKRRGKSQWLTN